jgi:hypothetical protein
MHHVGEQHVTCLYFTTVAAGLTVALHFVAEP